ncbi:hypothetical protein SDC9_134238 [bioreactor metagenome]|uniref:Uncharacterized protein n=1 Tax=bioreactor metagenome TaxID=1076179 RepID=A0A645DCM6_9ZZZZ
MRVHLTDQPEIVLGCFQSRMTHVDGQIGQACGQVVSILYPLVHHSYRIRVAQVMKSRPFSPASMRDARLPKIFSEFPVQKVTTMRFPIHILEQQT